MCFKILDEDDELSDDALEPGEENELEGVEFFDEEFFAAEELSCWTTSRESCSKESWVSE